MKVKTGIGLIIIVMSIFTYLNIYQDGGVINIENTRASPLIASTKSEDLIIDITKNASAIGPYSTIEFSVELTNTLSESLYDISLNISEISNDIFVEPATDPLFSVSSIDPETTIDFQFVTKYIANSSSSAVDVVLMIDASGSMQDEIDSVIAQLNDLIATLSAEIPDLRIGVIVFGWAKYSEYPMSNIYNYVPLTTDFDSIKSFINGLYASGGTEPWGDALYLANSWNWREVASKMMILIGDEDCDPGMIVGNDMREEDEQGFYNGSDLLDVVTSIKNKEIMISTVICGGADTLTINQFTWIAEYTDGTHVFLPELIEEGISLPDIIEEWTLELGREYSRNFNLTVYWRDGLNNNWFNTQGDSFWIDFTPPYTIISKMIYPTAVDLYSVEFFIEVLDISPIDFVSFYHNAYGSWGVDYLTPFENTSNYELKLQNVPGGVNLSYFVECSDILRNVGTSSTFWVIVEPKFDEFGEEVSFWVEADRTIYSNIKIPSAGTYYLIISGPNEIDEIDADLTVVATNSTPLPVRTTDVNISYPYSHRILQFNLGPGDHAATLTVPSTIGNFSSSYAWISMKNPVNNRFTDSMTDFVRVFGLEWEATNGTYFSFDNQVGSPLVLRAEVYTSNWELVSTFIVGGSLEITYNDSFNIL
ncbi:MAG: vWA domain-containing protein, partial [Candidatus Hodarchaeales archaeon]